MTIFKELRTYECCYEGLLVNKKYCSYGRVRKSLEEKKYRSFDYVLVLQHFCKTFLNKKPKKIWLLCLIKNFPSMRNLIHFCIIFLPTLI